MDSNNNVQRLASFEQSCAECHQQKIEVMSNPGLALLALPTLDMTAIETQGTNVGSWPLAATGDFDGPLPPVMRLLLSADPAAKEVLDQKDAQFDFSDLDPDQPKDVADSVTLAWSIKRLMFELARDGRPAIGRRIKEVTGVDLDSEQLKGLADSLEASVFQGSANRWLPDLKAEVGDQVPDYAASQTLPKREFEWSPQSVAALAKAIRTTSQQTTSLQNQPRREGSKWLAVNPLAGTTSLPVGSGVKKIVIDQAQPNDPPATPSQPPADSRVFVAKQSTRENSEWLATNPLAGDAGATAAKTPTANPIPSGGASQETPANATANQPQPATVWNRDEKSVVGWIRDDGNFQLRYQPTGHADETLKNWIDLVGQLSTVKTKSHADGLFGVLISNAGLGDCRRCHTADRRSDGQLSVNWQPKYRDPTVASFTRFSHGPHLTLPQLRDCSACHRLNPGQGNQDSFASFDPQEIQSNFADLTISDCAACHRSGSTSNSCTQCHNYHVGIRSE